MAYMQMVDRLDEAGIGPDLYPLDYKGPYKIDILWVTCSSCDNYPRTSGLGVELNFYDATRSSTASPISHGDQYGMLEDLWYRKKIKGACTNSHDYDVNDEWGMMAPHPGRWRHERAKLMKRLIMACTGYRN